MKILFVLPEYIPHSGAGISSYYVHYIRALLPHCEKIKVITGSGFVQRNDHFFVDGIEIDYLNPDRFNAYLKKFSKYELQPEFKKNLAAAWAMWEQAGKGEGFDIVECADFGLGFVPWVINPGIPVVTRLHGSAGQIAMHETCSANLVNDLHKIAELTLLPRCDCLITHSAANQSFWNKIFDQAVVKHLYPVYSEPAGSVLSKGRENYGMVTSRIQQWKGPFQLAEALAKMSAPPVINWIGRDMPFDGKQSTAQRLAAEYPEVWGTKIIPHPAVKHDEVKELQAKAKFGLITSTWDMFNFSCLEFLAAGTAVICSDGAGVAELIEHRRNGFKYPANDTDALANCIALVNNLNETEYQNLARESLKTIREVLSPQVLIPEYMDIYAQVKRDYTARVPDSFTNEVYGPSEVSYHFTEALDSQPIEKLTAYLFKRIVKKITNHD